MKCLGNNLKRNFNLNCNTTSWTFDKILSVLGIFLLRVKRREIDSKKQLYLRAPYKLIHI